MTRSVFTICTGPEAEYQHPVYLRNANKPPGDPENPLMRFREEFDYYSLGLVLMEIAFWRPLQSISSKILGGPEELLEGLLKNYIPMVKTYMGDPYGEAVESCLIYYKEADCEPGGLRERFNRDVVMPISEHMI
jgi:hypothetical protein